ncbi:MAG: hypothetical protein WCF85_14260 [Rhodospirillaceae bacterium]
MTIEWPLDLHPVEQSFYIHTLTAAPSVVGVVLGRNGARWVAELTVEPTAGRLPWLEALLTRQRAGAVELLLPNYTRLAGVPSPETFAAYAAEIGETRFDDDTVFDDGTSFFAGDAGSPTLVGGCRGYLVLTGCRPGGVDVLSGAFLQASPGCAHLVVGGSDVDQNGVALVAVAPPLREPPVPGLAQTTTSRVLMRMTGGAALASPTTPFQRARYRLSFVEVLT